MRPRCGWPGTAPLSRFARAAAIGSYRVAAEIEAAGGKAMPIVADVTSEQDMDELVRLTLDRFQRLDVMICNAGFGVAGDIEAVSAEQMRQHPGRQLPRHLLRRACRAAGLPAAGCRTSDRRLFDRRQARACRTWGPYSATKFAQVGLAESLRAELAGSDIHVSVVFPVSTETEFVDVMSAKPVRQWRASRSTSKRRPGRRRDRESDRPPGPEVYPYAKSRGLVWLNALAPGFCDRFVKKYGRKP